MPDADGYGLYISEPPYGEAYLVFDSDAYYGGAISGTSLELPDAILSYGVTYRWNMNSYNSAGWGSCSSPWYFTTVSDTPPNVNAFSVSPDSIVLGGGISFSISYTVSDDIGLQQTELWRANDVGGAPDWEGTDNPIITTPLSGQTNYSSSFTDAPPSVGTYWYGMHVVDSSGQWSAEPDPPGPIQRTVTVGPTPAAPPTHISPADGSILSTLTPTFTWSSVPDADGYGLYISEPPYGEAYLVFDSDAYYGGPISGTSLDLPDTILSDGVTYRWNMNSYNSAGWGSCSSAWSFTPTEPTPRVEGIDVSSIQGYVDWSQVYNAGYRFAFARASWGDENPPAYIDEYFETNMQNGHATDMLMGAYHFAYPEYTDPVSEAHHFLNVAGDYLIEGYLRPVLDLEDDPGFDSYPYRLGTEALSNWVHQWMDTIKNGTGIEPILYVCSNYANNYLDTSINQYDLWIAHWTYDPGANPDTGTWDDWSFWQYSDQGSVPGISSNTDLDLFNGDMSALNDFGISVGSTGWKFPTATGKIDNEWTNPNNGKTDDGNYTTAEGTYLDQDYYNFSFDLPAGAIINGIEVEVEGHGDGGGETLMMVEIWSASAEGGEGRWGIKDDGAGGWWSIGINGVDAVATEGGSTDKWGYTWVKADFDDGTFKAKLKTFSRSDKVYVDYIKAKVYYTELEGDINGDGKVDFTDFAILASQWLQPPGEPSADIAPEGGDGIVDFLDLALLTEHWLEGTTP